MLFTILALMHVVAWRHSYRAHSVSGSRTACLLVEHSSYR